MKKNLRYVIKVGTNSLQIKGAFKKIAKNLNEFYLRGGKPILVSSGAVAMGMKLCKLKIRPKDTKELQDLSAEGTRVLSNVWANEFAKYGIGVWYIQPTWQNFLRKEDSFDHDVLLCIGTNSECTVRERQRTGNCCGSS